jgi:hypothetical protein
MDGETTRCTKCLAANVVRPLIPGAWRCDACGVVLRASDLKPRTPDGVPVECIGGPLDGERHDYSLGDPVAGGGVYRLDRGYGERRGRRREYAYIWHPALAPEGSTQRTEGA